MRHQNERRRTTLVRQPFEKLQKMLARDRIESGARLVENQQLRTRHQRPPDQHAPVGPSIGLAQHRNLAGRGRHVASQRAQKRRLARAVGAEDRPMLPTLDHPVDRTKYQRVALDSQTRNFDNWRKSFRLSRPVRARSAMVVSGARSAVVISGSTSHSDALKRGYHAWQETAPSREYIRGAFRSEGNAWFLESLRIRPKLRRQSPCRSAPAASSPRPQDRRR